ncbi:fasciclin domain-containing protein [Aquimarina sp. ERC-38]|uniref:fasciclin domain-containing protein n=1 Tax=Aquimarina sp. ERC-38 TaxID=2949996 RepID=UPI002246FDA3|nr:fasciclin domain-containing protein [Aquimarina sp. ERC-38]UZO80397.1 fasciclin domain-containing protein [Aquimarina sp. ERC-38]
MKTYLRSLISILFVISLSSLSVNAQDKEDIILSKVEDSKMYKTIELAQMDRNLSTFVNLVALSGLETSMYMTDDHTLFIPTNEAFYDMTIEEFANLTNPKNRVELVKFIKYHVLPNKRMASEFETRQVISTEEDEEISVSADDNLVYIGGAQVIKSDIEASNGIVHIVNAVIKPTVSVIAGGE